MKVLFVKTDTRTVRGPQRPTLSVKERQIYIVTDAKRFNGELYYRLAEMDFFTVYWEGLFIPVSDIDETTFERNYQKETV